MMKALTYEQVVEAFRERFKNTDVSSVEGTLAFQINIVGKPEGIFYVDEQAVSASPDSLKTDTIR